jgi:transcriptional regulator GlxA family with amidase domain
MIPAVPETLESGLEPDLAMKSVLDRVTDWPQKAKDSRFDPKALAVACGVTLRHLERYFEEKLKMTPQRWLDDAGADYANSMLLQGLNTKEVADKLGFKDRSHFSRFFKPMYGYPPSAAIPTEILGPPPPALPVSATQPPRSPPPPG